MNKPPFEINDSIINLIAEINNKLGKLKISLDNKKDLFLRKISKIKSVNSSSAIEANTLTEKEVVNIINGKRVIAEPEEIIEIKNAYNAYLKISEYNEYGVKSLLQAHKYIMDNLKTDAGKFRKGNVAVYEGSKVVQVGARPEFVNDLMNDLFMWANTSNLNPLIKACIIHYEIETIHPFSDGNGRIGRLWQSVILYNYNKLFELIPIETLVYENQQRYYDVIEFSRKENSSTQFIEFMLNMILKTIDSFEFNIIKVSNNKIKDNYLNLLNKTEITIINQIINKFNSNEFFTLKEVKEIINKNEANLRKYFRNLEKHCIIITEGKNKGRKYKINKEIMIEDK